MFHGVIFDLKFHGWMGYLIAQMGYVIMDVIYATETEISWLAGTSVYMALSIVYLCVASCYCILWGKKAWKKRQPSQHRLFVLDISGWSECAFLFSAMLYTVQAGLMYLSPSWSGNGPKFIFKITALGYILVQTSFNSMAVYSYWVNALLYVTRYHLKVIKQRKKNPDYKMLRDLDFWSQVCNVVASTGYLATIWYLLLSFYTLGVNSTDSVQLYIHLNQVFVVVYSSNAVWDFLFCVDATITGLMWFY